MNTITRVFAVLMLVLCVGYANAREGLDGATYEVKENDVLSSIAEKFPGVTWQDIWKENKDKIKNPHRIYPKQELRIPKAKVNVKTNKSEQAVTNDARRSGTSQQELRVRANEIPTFTTNQVNYWRIPGQNPCQEPAEKAIPKLGFPDEVARALLKKVEERDHTIDWIKPGDRFDAMCFGKAEIWRNVEAAWKPGHPPRIPVKIYTVVHDGVRWELVYPEWTCKNWSKRTARFPPPAPPPRTHVPDEPPVGKPPPVSPGPTPGQPDKPKSEDCECPELITLAVFEPLPNGVYPPRQWKNNPREDSPFPWTPDSVDD